MAMSDYRTQREQDKFVETTKLDTAVRTLPELDANYILFDPDDSAPDYIGLNEDISAATSDTDWVIYKFTYSGSNITEIKKAVGSWNGKAVLF